MIFKVSFHKQSILTIILLVYLLDSMDRVSRREIGLSGFLDMVP